MPSKNHVGTVALIGRPNSGKSSFINALIGEKVGIISNKPQTTHKNVKGIFTDDDCQIVFFDTPGIHESQEAFNITITNQAKKALEHSDVIVRFIDASRKPGKEELVIDSLLESVSKPIVVVFSKMDLVTTKFPPNVLQISTADPASLLSVVHEVKQYLSASEQLYDEDIYTDQDIPSRVEDTIREKLYVTLEKELPYSVFVECQEVEYTGKMLKALVYVYVERDSQKPIVIGKNASVITEVGTLARIDLESIFDCTAFIQLRVKVFPKWKKNPGVLRRMFPNA